MKNIDSQVELTEQNIEFYKGRRKWKSSRFKRKLSRLRGEKIINTILKKVINKNEPAKERRTVLKLLNQNLKF